jgi:hypothetical protein
MAGIFLLIIDESTTKTKVFIVDSWIRSNNMDNKEHVKNAYESFTDSKLEFIALHEIIDLDEETRLILFNEVKKRGLSKDIIQAVKKQIEDISDDELKKLVEEYRKTPCPICNTTGSLLNGFMLKKDYKDYYIIGCHSCIKLEVAKLRKSLGQFSVRMLPSRARALFELENFEDKSEPSDDFIHYVYLHRGNIYRIVQKYKKSK